jgi:hypothetical protein
MFSENKILNKTKNHNPPLQVKIETVDVTGNGFV